MGGQIPLPPKFILSHVPFPPFSNPSINLHVNSDDFPCTWGTFNTIVLHIVQLPPGSQAAVQDVAEAYCTIPLHPSQWPVVVTCVRDNSFCIDTCTYFSTSRAAEGYGHVADAGTDIFWVRGVGPVSKWVNNHIFFRIKREYLKAYNQWWEVWCQHIVWRGPQLSGGCL